MTYEVPLKTVANQSLSTALNEHDVDISLKTAYDMLLVDITIDGKAVCAGVKCISEMPLIPRQSELALGGKLYFKTIDGSYPTKNNVGTTNCRLLFEEF